MDPEHIRTYPRVLSAGRGTRGGYGSLGGSGSYGDSTGRGAGHGCAACYGRGLIDGGGGSDGGDSDGNGGGYGYAYSRTITRGWGDGYWRGGGYGITQGWGGGHGRGTGTEWGIRLGETENGWIYVLHPWSVIEIGSHVATVEHWQNNPKQMAAEFDIAESEVHEIVTLARMALARGDV